MAMLVKAVVIAVMLSSIFAEPQTEHNIGVQKQYWYNEVTGATQWDQPYPALFDGNTRENCFSMSTCTCSPTTGDQSLQQPAFRD